MKTILPTQITTIFDAEAFLRSLHLNDESYHPEDDAHNIIWSKGTDEPTNDECDKLNLLMEEIYALDGFDPCGFILDII